MGVDLLLIFPPQWSPFQPPLSLPSLSAWLKRAGFSVACLDLNVSFYNWLLSDEGAKLVIERIEKVERSAWDDEKKLGFKEILSSVEGFRASIENLWSCSQEGGRLDSDEYIKRHYVMSRSLDTYLAAVSEAYDEFTISPYSFELSQGSLNIQTLERLVASPPDIISAFFQNVVPEYITPIRPKIIGLSCIGQEQLYFTLLLGALLKQSCQAPVVIGGTIFSRIFERGSLKEDWFSKFFDYAVRNEGEIPVESLLRNMTAGRPLTERVPGLVYCKNGKIVSTNPSYPLKPENLPIPDFDEMPLANYLSSKITLPLLSSRGCYWGKCEFCHHGMVYGDKYSNYGVDRLFETVKFLSRRYKVSNFAFNDEAIPPNIIRYMGQVFPPNEETGWHFTGLIKFERYFKKSDFKNLFKIGLRTLYVGLESASEHVLRLMKKQNKIETIARNLADATESGIWMHCFLFFGFPGETEEDAQQTYDFVLSNPEIMGSFGCGKFSLEHNSPIFKHLEDFGVKLKVMNQNDVDVYYDYETGVGITAARATKWARDLNKASLNIPKYRAIGWIPREHLLCLLSFVSARELIRFAMEMGEFRGLPGSAKLPELISLYDDPGKKNALWLVNRINRRVLRMTGNSAELMRIFYNNAFDVRSVANQCSAALHWLGFLPEDSPPEALTSRNA